MKKRKTIASLVFSQELLILFLFGLVAVIVWVAASISFSYTKSTLTPTDTQAVLPLNPHLDGALFDRLTQRKSWDSTQLSSFTAVVEVRQTDGSVQLSTQKSVVLPTPNPLLIAPPASASAKKTASASATQSFNR